MGASAERAAPGAGLGIVSSRGLAEYVAMLDLSEDDLAGRVLDCAGGASGLAAQSGRPGVVAADPAYALPRDVLAGAVERGLTEASALVAEHADRFTWQWYGTPAERDRQRRQAATAFATDLAVHPGRYVAAALPRLPFADASFDLAVVSHLLFTWAGQLDEDGHRAALRELLRVAAEVRVFPLVLAGTGDQVPFTADLLDGLFAAGVAVERRRVGYEFQVGGNEALVLRR